MAPSASTATTTPTRIIRAAGRACKHCEGNGREPAPLPSFEFSRSGERRGELQRLANDTGIDKSQLSEILRGIRTPSAAAIVLIARALDVTESRIIHYPPIWHRLCAELSDGE